MSLVFNYILAIEISTQTIFIFFSQGVEAMPTKGSEVEIRVADFLDQGRKDGVCRENEHHNNTRQGCEEYCSGRNGKVCYLVRFFFIAIATDQVCILISSNFQEQVHRDQSIKN